MIMIARFLTFRGKTNVIADALSRRACSVASFMVEDERLWEWFSNQDVSFREHENGVYLATLQVEMEVLRLIREEQVSDEYLRIVWEDLGKNGSRDFRISKGGMLMFRERTCVPAKKEIRCRLLDAAHRSAYSIHPGIKMMYHELRRKFWWHGLKQHVTRYIGRYETC